MTLPRIIGLHQLALGVVEPDHDLNVVTIGVDGMPGAYQVVLARDHALDLANRLLNAVLALRARDRGDLS